MRPTCASQRENRPSKTSANAYIRRITLSVLLTADDATFTEIDVAPETTLENLKNQLVVMLPEDQSQQSWLFSHRQNVLPNDDTHTLQQAGVNDGDMVQVIPQSMLEQQPQSRRADPRQHPRESDKDRERFEQVRQHFIGSPEARAEFVSKFGHLAHTLDDPTQFRNAWRDLLIKNNAAVAAEDARLNDEINEENQAKIYERIRLDNIQKDFDSVMDTHPELLGRVTMLYVNLFVNGHPVKAFVDSGAQATIISPSCADACGITHLIDTQWSGIARGVGTARILGRIHKAPFKLSEFGYDEICCFTVMEGKGVDMLLGLDLLKRYQGTIDLANNKLVLGGESVSFLPEAEIPKFLEDEPVVEGPHGAAIGAQSGALKSSPTTGVSSQNAGAGSSSSASASKAPVPGSGFTGAGRTLGPSTFAGPSTSQPPQRPPQQQQPPQHQQQPPRPSAPTPARAAAPLAFPQSSIDTLQEHCGATREQAVEALKACGGNIDAAAALLYDF